MAVLVVPRSVSVGVVVVPGPRSVVVLRVLSPCIVRHVISVPVIDTVVLMRRRRRRWRISVYMRMIWTVVVSRRQVGVVVTVV